MSSSPSFSPPRGVRVLGPLEPGFEAVLDADALAFVARLERELDARRRALLDARVARQAELDRGARPDFPAETAALRARDWRVAPPPADLVDRRVEITGPVERKMIVNALNSGASVFMADFEDSSAPTWANGVRGQVNLRDAVRRTIEHVDARTGKRYVLGERPAVLFVRPRGLHLVERHLEIDGRPASGALFDFGLFAFHNARELLARGSGPYFYLPKLESRCEARWWNDAFALAERELGLPHASIKATVLIETILAAFEMDEILWELRERSAGLNCGRWDYIFSFIKKLKSDPRCVLPDRGSVGMDRHFLRSYSRLLIATCHRRGAHAMGGMAAQIPIKDDPAANRAALDKVVADKTREAGDGHDGTWVAHPGLVAVAREVFDRALPGPNQIESARGDASVGAADLLRVPEGAITEAGLRQNVSVGIQYLAAWLAGNGCVPIRHLMEDAATAEISRAQVWQWLRHGARLDDGRLVEAELVRRVVAEELAALRASGLHDAGRLELARALFEELCLARDFAEFLTLPAYERLIALPSTDAA